MNGKGNREEIVITAPAFTVSSAPHWAAQDMGFFHEEGLEATIAYIFGQEGKWLGDMFPGKTVFHAPGGSAPFVAAREGRAGEIVNIISVQDRAAHVMIARPEIKSIADLKGKRIMAGVQGASFVDACFTLRHFGLDPRQDIAAWVKSEGKELDTERSRIDSLSKGEIDAVCSGPPHWCIAEKMGFRRLPSARDLARWAINGLSTTKKVIQEKPEVVKKVVRALIKGAEFVRMNKEETLDIMARNCPYVDRDTLDGCYDELHNQWYVTAEEELYRKTIAVFCREYAMAPGPIENYYELRFVREALLELRLAEPRVK